MPATVDVELFEGDVAAAVAFVASCGGGVVHCEVNPDTSFARSLLLPLRVKGRAEATALCSGWRDT